MLGLVGLLAAGFFVLVIVGAATQQDSSAGTSVDDETGVDHTPGTGREPRIHPRRLRQARRRRPRQHALSQGGLANGNCPAKDLGDAGSEEQTASTGLMDCLNDEWRPPVEAAGYAYKKPGLVVFDSPSTRPAATRHPRTAARLAFYCPGDAVMYADVPQMRKFFDNIDVAYAIVIGHEFGHHVQDEAGILEAYDEARL